MNAFGSFLKIQRQISGLTQEELAELMNVSKNTIQNWESGRTKVKTDNLKKLAYYFNISETELIQEMNRSVPERENDNFPYFLFCDDDIALIKTLHLNINQQELFGLMYLYSEEDMPNLCNKEAFSETARKIPYEFIAKVGSIHFLNLSEGLYNVLKYVKWDFLLKILKLYPDEEFDICSLPKEVICDFIDTGIVDEFSYSDEMFEPLYIPCNMKKARVVLPILAEKEKIHLCSGMQDYDPSEDIPTEVFKATFVPEGARCMTTHITEGLGRLTTYETIPDSNGVQQTYWKLNEQGRKLCEWFKE